MFSLFAAIGSSRTLPDSNMKTLLLKLVLLIFFLGCFSEPEIVERNNEPKKVDTKLREQETVADLEARLFQLSDDELFEIGITAIDGNYWSVAWSNDSDTHFDAITDALATAGLSAQGSFGKGAGGWYVHRTNFFAATDALKRCGVVDDLEITIVEPTLNSR